MSFFALTDVEPLDWFPKQFQPGDMDSTGGDRLLGRTELSPLEILIRETAQNSWDARLDGRRPTYGIHLRRIDWRLRMDLARLLPDTARPESSARLADNPFVLEIFDRGTTGLDGPVTLQPVVGDSPRNFQDLILKLGVPRDDGKGGGTYGFGKTASYAFSSRGTVVYWTRCRNESGQLEHRLIASAFRESYTHSGVQYTGRHWWGRREGDMILPLIGEEAEALGSQLFDRGFVADETGTSMIILDPDLSLDSLGAEHHEQQMDDMSMRATLFRERARAAVRAHLWPKLVPEPVKSAPPMDITLQVEGTPVALADVEPGALALWGAGLNAIRAVRAHLSARISTPQGVPVRVVPITRYQKTIGHLAIVQRVQALESGPAHDDLDPTRNPAISRIALMRGQPELIVSTVDWVAHTPLEGLEWLAVYKAADDWDAVYARAEPPAHDAWIGTSGGEEGLVVKATRTRVVNAIREALYPEPSVDEPDRTHVRTGSLSRRFGVLLPAPHVSSPPSRGTAPVGAGRRKKTSGIVRRIDASPPRLIETYEDGRQRQRVDFVVHGGPGPSIVKLAVSVIGDEGVHEPLDDDQLEAAWNGADPLDSTTARVESERPVRVDFTGVGRRALRIDLTAEDADGHS